jgi:hypothetical protein
MPALRRSTSIRAALIASRSHLFFEASASDPSDAISNGMPVLPGIGWLKPFNQQIMN